MTESTASVAGLRHDGVTRTDVSPRALRRSLSVEDLSSACAERDGNAAPCALKRERRREMKDDPTDRDLDAHAELDQPLAQGRDLGPCAVGALSTKAEFLHQHISCRRHQHPELVGPETGTAGPVDLQAVMQFLDPVLDLTPLTVDPLVDPLRILSEVGDEEAGIVFRVAPWMADDFGLEDDASLVGPAAGGVAALPVEVFGLTRLRGATPDALHAGLGETLEDRVARHGDDVLHGLEVEIVQDLRCRESSVQTNEEGRGGECVVQAFDETSQKSQGAQRGRSVAGTQNSGDKMLFRVVVEADEGGDRKIAPGVVMTVEERELLSTVGGVVGGIELKGDAPSPATQPSAVPLDDDLGQRFAETIERPWTHGVLESGEGRLGRQGVTIDRMTIDEQFMDRVVGETRGVVGVRVTAGDGVDTLPEELHHLMLDFPRLSIVRKRDGEPLGQSETGIGCLEKHGAAVGAAVMLIEPGDERAIEESGEQHTLCRGRIRHRRASGVAKPVSQLPFTTPGASLCPNFMNYPG